MTNCPPPGQSYRDMIAGLPPKDAVELLLEALQDDAHRAKERRCAVLTHLGVNVPAGPLSVLICLWRARGEVVSREGLIAAIEAENPSFSVSSYDLTSHVKRARAALRAHKWPIEIETFYKSGYRLVNHDPEWSLLPKGKTT